MRGWLMCRCSARSLTFTAPAVARRSRIRRRVGLAKARKWSGISFRGFWRNIKVPLCTSLTHKGSFICDRPDRGPITIHRDAAPPISEVRAELVGNAWPGVGDAVRNLGPAGARRYRLDA